jgi:putative membrane protein
MPSLLALAMAAGQVQAQTDEAVSSIHEGPVSPPGENPASTASLALTDGQVLQVVRTLNDGEIKQAKLAADKTDDAQVQSVAQMLRADHEASNQQIEAIEDANDAIDLDGSDTSEALAALAEQTSEGLEDLEGAQFACEYLTKQEQAHELALDTVNNQLLPAAANSSVKALLAASAPTLEHHLEMTKAVRANLAGCG